MLWSSLKATALGIVLAVPSVMSISTPLPAQTADPGLGGTSQLGQIAELLMIDDLLAVVRQEGVTNTAEMDADLLAGGGGASWVEAVSQVYDPAAMRAQFDLGFSAALQGDAETQAAMLAFFDTPLGRKILRLEIEARRSLLEPDIEDAAAAVWQAARGDAPARVAQLEGLVIASDLIESNVMGALNANLAFFRGLEKGGGFDAPMTESDMLAAVWQQEGDIRKETVKWLYPYLYMAYQPLSDAELDQYLAFSTSAAGKRANAALFAGFDVVFAAVSQNLGLAAAGLMNGDDI